MGLTKLVLKRPVTTVLMILCLVVFGLQAFMSSPLELMPEMNMSMIVVMTPYPGASPEDVNELVTKTVEGQVGTLSGLDTVSSMSRENVSITMLEYKYGTDMDKAYDDLKKQMDLAKVSMPDEVEDPIMLELNANLMANMILAVSKDNTDNLYNYVNDDVVPELEKLNSVAEVSINGGSKEYIRVELLPEKMNQYGVSMNSIATDIGSADLAYPAGNADMGDQQLAVSTDQKFDTLESLQDIPLTVSGKNTIYLGDVANIYLGEDDTSSIARYNGQDTIAVSVTKQQDAASLTLSSDVHDVVDELTAADPDLNITVVMDTKDNIMSSLTSVFQTMIAAIVISMVIIWMFFGDIKASLIVGSSIPVSILASFVLMNLMGFSLNVITLSALVLGVGMMVDNSINVLDGCFRAKEKMNFYDAAIEGSRTMIGAITGGTVTTCVVFLPLALLSGLSGQLFKQLGFTIVFCMIASLFSAVSIVPLCFYQWHPKENDQAPVNGMVKSMQSWYRSHMPSIIPRTKLVLGTSVLFLVLALLMASRLNMDLMSSVDEGIVQMTVKTKPGLSVEAINETLSGLEEMVMNEEDVDHYLVTYGSSGLSMGGSSDVTLSAYLKDDRKLSTDQVIDKWRRETERYKDMSVTLKQGSTTSSGSMSSGDQIEIDLQSTDYQALKAAANDLTEQLRQRRDVMQVHSSVENAAPVVKVDIDPVSAQAEGLTPAGIGSAIYSNLSGIKASTIRVNGEDVDIKVEYAKDRYDTIDKLQGMMINTASGTALPLEDLAQIRYEDSPQQISRKDKQYQVSITMEPQAEYKKTAEKDVKKFVSQWKMPPEVELAANSLDEMMGEELGALGGALVTGVFLIFIVMAIQFESPKFSLMVMTTIPFSLIGSFGLLYLAGSPISMVSMLGFLMLVGTVVNNGILYVETVNQMLPEMPLDQALVEAGAIRMRPILMTTLTTVISMVPNALAYGKAGKMMQGLALVDVGGLLAATVLTLILLPTYYKLVYNLGRRSLGGEGVIMAD